MNLSLTDIEKELRELSDVNSTAWIQMYKLLTIVESEKLYKDTYSSYTEWVDSKKSNSIFDPLKPYLLREIKEIGDFCSEFQRRMQDRGKQVSMDDFQGIAIRELKQAKEFANVIPELEDEFIIEVLQHGKVRTKFLSEILNAIDKCYEEEKESIVFDMTRVIKENKICVRESIETETRCRKRYKAFRMLRVGYLESGHPRRIDALVVETINTEHSSQIKLHGIKVKVSRSDLLKDINKMSEYTSYVDRFWIAVPSIFVCYAEELAMPCWGILAVDVDEENVKVIRPAAKNSSYGTLREKSLEMIINRMLVKEKAY